MAQPTVPPRPARSTAQATLQPQPMIPPRPIRKTDPSPDREAFARSPLNFLPNSNGPTRPPSNPIVNELKRQPSIDLPSEVGQEGAEYISYDHLPAAAHGISSTTETKNVSADVPLQQPRASVPSSTAKERISTVTRTDSSQAAAAGIGKARPEDDVHKHPDQTGSPLGRSRTADEYHPRRAPSADAHPLRARASFNRSNTSLGGTPRPPSIHGDHHHDGIPEIGRQIPLNPFAGDVQAPSPGPGQAQFTQGIGFFNDGSARAHHRKRSSRHEFGPPGSYGMHGHGMEPQDQFERDWIAKHPQEAAKEGYNTWVPKPAAALSSEQLNRIVTHSDDAGMGTNRSMIGTPSQEIAFDATEKYMMRMNSPKPSPLPLKEGGKRHSSGSHPAVESPLRKTSFPFKDTNESAVDDDVIHVDDIYRTGADHSDDIRRNAKRPGVDDAGYSSDRPRTPILASDEVLKRPGSAHMHAAVVSEFRDDDYYYDSDHHNSRRSSLHVPSGPSSRPNSVHSAHGPPAGFHHSHQPGHKEYHGGPLHRYISHEEQHHSGMGTPLEEIEEYEPLFPDDDKAAAVKKTVKARPRLAEHHFPSQDIWEDTPSSLQYVAEVQTPEPLDSLNEEESAPASKVFEHPATEEKRKVANPANMLDDSKTFAKPHFKPDVQRSLQEPQRPGAQRFPSHDIWEDTPSELQLVTTVSGPQEDDDDEQAEERPTTNAIPGSQDDPTARSTTGSGANFRPSVPERPQRGSKLAQEIAPAEVPDLGADKRQAPSMPDRPKPTVPARPARDGAADGVDSARSPPQVKAKPAVPARPGGSKIAALQAGFMNDLNNRLRQGPQGPISKPREAEEEEESEKAPLQDARKGRAKGPPRRTKNAPHEPSPLSFSITTATLWQIDESDELNVTSAANAPVNEATLEKVLSANEASNTREPALQSPPADGDVPEPDDDAKLALASQPSAAAIGAEGDLPEPAISESTLASQKAIQPELETSLHGDTKDGAAQTGEKKMVVTSPEGTKEDITAFVGGQAPEEGDVVIKSASS